MYFWPGWVVSDSTTSTADTWYEGGYRDTHDASAAHCRPVCESRTLQKPHVSPLLRPDHSTYAKNARKKRHTIPLHMKLQHLHQLEGLREDQDLVRALLVPLPEEGAEDL